MWNNIWCCVLLSTLWHFIWPLPLCQHTCTFVGDGGGGGGHPVCNCKHTYNQRALKQFKRPMLLSSSHPPVPSAPRDTLLDQKHESSLTKAQNLRRATGTTTCALNIYVAKPWLIDATPVFYYFLLVSICDFTAKRNFPLGAEGTARGVGGGGGIAACASVTFVIVSLPITSVVTNCISLQFTPSSAGGNRDVVYVGCPIATTYMSPDAGGGV